MKRGLTKTAWIALALGILAIAIIAIYSIAPQFPYTEKAINKFMETVFPSKMESVVIPGTAVGAICPTITIKDADELAQAVVDCWNKGKQAGRHLECCYNIDPSKLKTEIQKTDLQNALRRNSKLGKYMADASCRGMTWDSESFTRAIAGKAKFTVCYDRYGCDEVYVTYYPQKRCVSSMI